MSSRFEKWEQKIDNCKGSRQSFAIQLDWSNPDDVELIKIIALLKDNDKFSEAMRKALRIIPAMMFAGSLAELFEEFPWAKLEALEYLSELFNSEPSPDDTPPPSNTPPKPDKQVHTDARREQVEALREQVEAQKRWVEAEQERLEAEREWQERRLEKERKQIEEERQQNQTAIQKQLQRLEELLLKQGHVPVQSTSETVAPEPDNPADSGIVGIKSIGKSSSGVGLKGANFDVPPPVFDDDDEDPVIKVEKLDGAAANAAFMSMLNNTLAKQ